MTRTAWQTGSNAVSRALKSSTSAAGAVTRSRKPSPSANWSTGIAVGGGGACRYWLYRPPGVRRTERLPLLVMLHGCRQDAEGFSASTGMNRIAARERFLVLYPEKDRFADAHRCWNWYDTQSGRAQREAGAIEAAISQVCETNPVDSGRVALAGLSAGAGIAGLLAVRYPERFRAVAMHSGVAPGTAHSGVSALRAMRGRKITPEALAPLLRLPPLLVIHGASDPVVVCRNGAETARLWAAQSGAKPSKSRSVQRGARYAATVTDYRVRGRLVATHCEIHGLGHAWSGGKAGHAYSDPKGPDAARMIWSFMARQFALASV